MSKARKVKVASKASKPARPSPKRPAIHKVTKKKAPARPEPRHEAASPPPKVAPSPPGGGRPGIARLAAMAAAAADADEPEVQVRSKPTAPAPKGGVQWEDYEDDEDEATAPKTPAAPSAPLHPTPAPAKTRQEVEDGVQLVARTASKFSLADIEALRSAIKVKGAVNVVDGVNLDELKFDAEGLIPVIAQDRRTGAVLTLGWGNKETLGDTLRSKQVSYFDRTRQKAVVHGEGTNHHQRFVKLQADCDKDSVLLTVEQEGPACHLDTGTCFGDSRALPLAGYLGELDATLAARGKAKEGHDGKLLGEPIEALRAFVGSANTISKALQGKDAAGIETAAADLLRTLLVACRARGIGLEKIVTDLYARAAAEQLKGQKSG